MSERNRSEHNRRKFFLAFGAVAMTGQALAQQIHQSISAT